MRINKIRITNFKSIYGVQEFDFSKLDGMIKLSGPIGAGKTTLCEAILYGLYGSVKDHKIPNLVAWNTGDAKVEIWLTSKNRNIYIDRNVYTPTCVYIDDKEMQAPNKNEYQNILEEYYDVPRMAVEKMCLISFNQFNSLAKMNPAQTKAFLDDVFGFKTFTIYNDVVVDERRQEQNNNTALNTIIAETSNQIENLKRKKQEQQDKLANQVDVTGLNEERERLIEEGKTLSQKITDIKNTHNSVISELKKEKQKHYDKKLEYSTLGRQQKQQYETFKSGVCPTCGQTIEQSKIDELKSNMNDYANKWREEDALEKDIQNKIVEEQNSIISETSELEQQLNNMRNDVRSIDSKLHVYKSNLQLMKDNFDTLINEAEHKLIDTQEQLSKSDIEIGEWNDMNEMFTKSLRYKLLDSLIPHINNSIQKYINKLEQNYQVKFDQEFKCHIYIDNNDKEINYMDLSTGQKKTLDIAMTFGIIENIIANVDLNVMFLDELFGNMDSDSRNLMLEMIKSSLAKDKSIFVCNHSEMSDDYFTHKIRVNLHNKKVIKVGRTKKTSGDEVIVHASKYEIIF